MRVLAGKYKGKNLIGSADNSVRPTTNKIKDYIFNILHDFCEDKTVADIFSGSGSLGIESLSRGAKHVTFVDESSNSIKILKNNLTRINLNSDRYKIVNTDAIKFSKEQKQEFELILMDPPFYYPPLNVLLNSIFKNRILIQNGILVVEHEISNPVNSDSNLFEIIKQKRVGRSLISFIINKGSINV